MSRTSCLGFLLVLLLLGPAAAVADPIYHVVSLGTLGSHTYGGSINNHGEVTGRSYVTYPGNQHAFLYSGRAMVDLGTRGGSNSYGTGINNSGQVVGSSSLAGAGAHAFLYDAGTMTDLGTLEGSLHSTAYDINNSGQIVGAAYRSTYGSFRAHIYSGGAMTDLNTLIDDGGLGWYLMEANDINDSGQILATGYSSSLGYRAFRLDPIHTPQPGPNPGSALLLLGMGLTGLSACRRWSRAGSQDGSHVHRTGRRAVRTPPVLPVVRTSGTPGRRPDSRRVI